jgi:acyl-CoA synthetase (AMP-forming)/AMP-acid ligase II
MRDRRCYLHFVDRIGDTYRWRGENVSTSEVGMALSKWQELDECVVVGAAVPGADGRAGLAAVTLREGVGRLDLQGLLEVARTSLPAYAVPLFVRVCAAKLDSTGTFKLQKGKYRSEGIDPSAVGGDPLYYLDPKEKRYLPLTPDVYKKLEQGAIKL